MPRNHCGNFSGAASGRQPEVGRDERLLCRILREVTVPQDGERVPERHLLMAHDQCGESGDIVVSCPAVYLVVHRPPRLFNSRAIA